MDTKTITGVGIVFKHIPEGYFFMGKSDNDSWGDKDRETPTAKIFLKSYWIGKYPITNGQFLKFLQSTNYQPRDHYKDREHMTREKLIDYIVNYDNNPKYPVSYVSWYDAIAFCKWVSSLSKLIIRLPTEAEWEKAARGTNGYIFPWGNTDPMMDYAKYYNGDSSEFLGKTYVGKYSPLGDSPYGCTDMVGNVFDWTNSRYEKYPYNDKDGREKQVEFQEHPFGVLPERLYDNRIIRGGSYSSKGSRPLRCSYRLWFHSGFRREDLGFRVVCDNM